MIIQLAQTQSDFISLVLLRLEVFVNEQNVDVSLELDEQDKTCRHYVVYDDDKLVATCRILEENVHCWYVGRVAVSKTYRKQGIGSLLLNEMERLARIQNINSLKLGAQVQAVPFYKQCGYVPYGDVYADADIEHIMMEKSL